MILYTNTENKTVLMPKSKLFTIKENMEQDTVTLYHRVGYNKRGMTIEQAINSVKTNGLIPYDSGDGMGDAIWFSNSVEEYGKNGSFVLSIDLPLSQNGNKNKWHLVYNGTYALAYKPISFQDLNVIKIPVMKFGTNIVSNTEFIEWYTDDENRNESIVDSLNSNPYQIVIYTNIFNEYVQPYMKTQNILNNLNSNNIKIIEI